MPKMFKFYRNHYRTEGGVSAGFQWFTSRAAAEAAAKEVYDPAVDDEGNEPEVAKVIEIEPTKRGLLWALNRYAGHPDNG